MNPAELLKHLEAMNEAMQKLSSDCLNATVRPGRDSVQDCRKRFNEAYVALSVYFTVLQGGPNRGG